MFVSFTADSPIADDGRLQVHNRHPTRELVEVLTGDRGLTRIPLARGHRMIGWASASALQELEHFGRNPLGACVLATLGAAKQVYAGRIVITGFLYDEGDALLDLTENQRSEIENLDLAVRHTLASVPIPAEVESYLDLHPDWPDAMRVYADQVIKGDVPPATFR
jgi:hypothetical protein